MEVPKSYKLRLLTALVLYASILGIVTTTSPGDAPVALVMAPLALLGGALFVSIKLFLDALRPNRLKLNTMVSSSVSSASVLALMLSALGQVKLIDLIMLLSLVGLAVFYFNRTWPK